MSRRLCFTLFIFSFITGCLSQSSSNSKSKRPQCKLPPYPKLGKYTVTNNPNAVPGETYPSVHLNITCNPGLVVEDNCRSVRCFEGMWSHDMPRCLPPAPPKTSSVNNIRPIDSVITQSQGGSCKLPPYPKYGTYSVTNNPNAVPGQTYPNVHLDITCNPGLGVEDNGNSIWCIEGHWSKPMPKCVRFCRLQKHPSIEYQCLSAVTGIRECGPQEPGGTVVRPVCRYPDYYYPGELADMNCVDGNWDYIPICKPECGTITPSAKPLIIGGRLAKKGEFPWHAGIYSKLYIPYMQVCGGSLINTKAIISAAHCFWNDYEKKLPPEQFAVAVGKLYRPWDNERDEDAQKSDVAEIRLTQRYQGSAANFQDDIAVVVVVTPFVYQRFIRPVCLNFDATFDNFQLIPGTYGKVAGWGFTTTEGKSSSILKVVELPIVAIDECRAVSPIDFRVYLTSEKLCAGYTNGTTLCQGDSGGGLAVPAVELSTLRYYLRGVVSVSPSDDNVCSIGNPVAFTHITKHEYFIKGY